jgi:hypothetical protein
MLDALEHELERVRSYRADVTEPDAVAVAAARAQLMAAISAEPRPARTARRRAPARERLQRRRRFALAGGLATIGVGVAGALGLTTAATPVSALAAQMNTLAKVAASQDWSGIPGPGQYLYTESEGLSESDGGADGKECVVRMMSRRRIWIATDGSGALSSSSADAHFTSAADAAVCAGMNMSDPDEQVGSSNSRFPAGGLSFPTNNWKALSTDPATVLKQAHQLDGGPDTPAEWFVNVTDFMRESDVPPAIRAALYQALPLIPGVKLLGAQADPAGQSGVGVAFYQDNQISTELVFDPQSARMLAEEHFDAGKLTLWTAYIAQRIVGSVPNYPVAGVAQPSSAGTSTSGSTPSATSSAPSQGTATTDTTPTTG